MAKDVYRSAKTGVSGDEWYQSLTPHTRLLFWTIWNSRDMTACGTAKTTIPTLCFETGLTRPELLAAMDALCAPFKSETLGCDIARFTWWPQYNVIWSRNFYKLQRNNTNPLNFDTSARASLDTVPKEIRQAICIVYPSLSNRVGNPSEWDTHGIPNPSTWDTDGTSTHGDTSNILTRNKEPESLTSIEAKEEQGWLTESPAADATVPSPGGKQRAAYTPQFEEVWASYPRRDGTKRGSKADAWVAWQRMKTAERAAAEEMVAVYAKLDSTKEQNGRFVVDAERWLKEKRWETVQEEWQAEQEQKLNGGQNGKGTANITGGYRSANERKADALGWNARLNQNINAAGDPGKDVPGSRRGGSTW